MADASVLRGLWEDIEAGPMLLLDLRPPRAFHHDHVPGSVSTPYRLQGFGPSVAAFLSDRGGPPFALVSDNQIVLDAARQALQASGLTPAAAIVMRMAEWTEAGLPSVRVPDLSVDHLFTDREQFVVLDVREPYEWRSGVIPGALTLPMGTVPDESGQFDRGRRYAVVCAHGNRSQAVASFLAEQGFDVMNVAGGMMAWLQAGYPVQETAAP
jgi:rhodanese-related sulfurtransferase